jgi:hypothetical protein
MGAKLNALAFATTIAIKSLGGAGQNARVSAFTFADDVIGL